MGLLEALGIRKTEVQKFTAKYRPPYKDFQKFARKHARMSDLWRNCRRSDWMLWMIGCINFTPACSMRLFACYCANQFRSLMSEPRLTNCIEAAQKFARNEIKFEEMEKCRALAYEVLAEAKRKNDPLAEALAWSAASTAKEDGYTAAVDAASYSAQIADLRNKNLAEMREMQARKLRDLLGNPFIVE